MKNWIINLLFSCISLTSIGQFFPEGIPYQAQVTSSSGVLLNNQTVGVQFNLRLNTINGSIVWQENHIVATNDLGHFNLNIGEGNSTGIGSASLFSQINWENGPYFLEMLIDETNSGSFTSVSTQQLMAVPFAFHSKTSAQQYKLSQLLDVDTSGIQINDVLKWNGSQWVPAADNSANQNDTVVFSYFSDSTNYATYTTYALNCVTSSLVDSSNYSFLSDTSNFANSSLTSTYSDSSLYADTANIAQFSIGNWGLNGNDLTNNTSAFIGSTDSSDFIIKTNSIERMRIKANGQIGFGTTTPLGDFHINNNNGVLFTGTIGQGTIPTLGAGTRMMWYPSKAAFRTGRVTGTTWDDSNIGLYSFATGYNTRASGDYSAAFGNASYATAEGAFAVGNQAAATGYYSFAAGHNPQASGANSIVLGRGGIASDSSAVAIGYHPTASGKYAMCFSNYGTASGDYSYAFGYHAQAIHMGSFVYADKSTESYLQSTASNQFMVRASGGYIFYTSSDLSTGVVLTPGSGSWSTLSDSTKKENITTISPIEYLNKLNDIEVYSWNYKSQNENIKHIGPMAQDFYSVFGFGNDSTTINTGDFDGINLVLIKGLNEKINTIENQKERINLLEKELELLKQKRLELEEMLNNLENKYSK